ncbi:MAG: hypothetical protein UZ05_CHB002000321 [Chlorobi bacterium OLB5]|nr:MAG: hypothetical protein UZ05_CHB002000321 [Chlorobi bacterium OLB5]
MIKDIKLWEEFEKEWTISHKLTIEESFRLFDEMKKIAIDSGNYPPKDLLESLDEKVKFVKRMQMIK